MENDTIDPYSYPDIVETSTNYTDIVLGRQSVNTQQQSITSVNVGLQSQLIAPAGTTVQIYFEVTNLRDQPVFHNFNIQDEQKYLRAMQPLNAVLNPNQMINVVVTAFIPQAAEVGTRDKLTFTSQGVGTVTQSAFLTVSATTGSQDSAAPTMYYTYGSRCEGNTESGKCAGKIWTLEIEARDYETGILRLQSVPRGLYYRTPFTAGTRDPVFATFTASCCQPKVTITVYDLSRNQKTVTLDVTDVWLSDAAIAAVTLGCILLVIFVLLLIWCIVWCCRRRKESRDLPVYRGGER